MKKNIYQIEHEFPPAVILKRESSSFKKRNWEEDFSPSWIKSRTIALAISVSNSK